MRGAARGGSTFAFQELCYNNELALVQFFIIKHKLFKDACIEWSRTNHSSSMMFIRSDKTALDKALKLDVILDLDELFV